jgi:hypothetical protein
VTQRTRFYAMTITLSALFVVMLLLSGCSTLGALPLRPPAPVTDPNHCEDLRWRHRAWGVALASSSTLTIVGGVQAAFEADARAQKLIAISSALFAAFAAGATLARDDLGDQYAQECPGRPHPTGVRDVLTTTSTKGL